jgi:hypothetical protein
MKKSDVKKEAINIDEITKLYVTYASQEKETKKKADEYKEQILCYANENRKSFNGKTLELPNGVRVEKRETEKANFTEDEITVDWISDALDNNLGDAIEIKINPKEIKKLNLNGSQQEILGSINYEVEVKETLAVCVSS